MAGVPASRTVVLGPLEGARWRPTDPTPPNQPRSRGKLEARANAIQEGGPPSPLRAPEDTQQSPDSDPDREDWPCKLPAQVLGPWLQAPRRAPAGWQWETTKHVMLDRPCSSRERMRLHQAVASTDFQWLTPPGSRRSHEVVPPAQPSPQFSWAHEQLPPA